MKLAIVVGHNARKGGAVRPDTKQNEFKYNSNLAVYIKQYCLGKGIDARIFNRKYDADLDGQADGYTKEIKTVYGAVDEWGADASIELHFNAGPRGATGTEVFSSGTRLSLVMAQEVQSAMVSHLGLPDRGVKTRSKQKKGRGYLSLISGNAPAILIEPFFKDNKRDLSLTVTSVQQQELAWEIVSGLEKAFEKFPRKTLKGSRTINAVKKQKQASLVGFGSLGGAVALGSEELIGNAETALEAVGAAKQWAEYLPSLAPVLIVFALIAFFYMRHHSNHIERARIDDNEKGLR